MQEIKDYAFAFEMLNMTQTYARRQLLVLSAFKSHSEKLITNKEPDALNRADESSGHLRLSICGNNKGWM